MICNVRIVKDKLHFLCVKTHFLGKMVHYIQYFEICNLVMCNLEKHNTSCRHPIIFLMFPKDICSPCSICFQITTLLNYK